MTRLTPDHWETFRRSPSEETFAPIFEQTRRLVFTICRRLLRNEDDALDAFQGTYCRLLEAIRAGTTSEPEPDPAAFVGRLAYREADRVKKQTTRRALKEEVMETVPDVPGSTPTPQDIAARHELRQRVEALVDTLPDDQRVPILLHYFHSLSQTEIAKIEGVPVSTISRRIARGMEKLRPRMLRAGLGEATTTLGACLAVAQLLDPGQKAAASGIFQFASQSLTGTGAGAGAGASSATAGGAGAAAAGGAAAWWIALLHSKAAVVAAVCVLGAAGTIIALKKSTPPPAPPSPPAAAASLASPAAPPAPPLKPSVHDLSPTKPDETVPKSTVTPTTETTATKAKENLAAKTASSESNPADKKPRSDARFSVSGQVLLPDGSPAERATVAIYSFTVKYPIIKPVSTVEAQTTTDQDGQYALEVNDDLLFSLVANKEGFAQATAVLMNNVNLSTGYPLPPGLRSATQNLVLATPALLQGVVKDDKGHSIAGAVVRAQRRQKDSFSTIVPPVETSTDNKGKFVLSQLRQGAVTLFISSENYTPVLLKTEAPNNSLEVRLSSEGASIQGRVYRKSTGEAVENAEISILSIDPNNPGFPIAPPLSTRSDDTGAFHFDHLSPGFYLPTVHKGNLYQLMPKNVMDSFIRLNENETKTDCALFLFTGYTVTGTVTDKETGAPIEGVSVGPPATILDLKAPSSLTDAQGRYRLEHLTALGDQRLKLEKEGYESISNGDLEFDPEKLEFTKDFQMTAEKTRGVVLSGTVNTPYGSPVSAAAVSLYGAKGETRTNTNGQFELHVAAFHPALIRVEAPAYPVGASKPIDVLDKPITGIDIVLSHPATIRGTVVNPQGNPVPDAAVTSSQYRSLGSLSYREQLGKQTTLADGTFQITNLPEGAILLKVEKFGFPTLANVKVEVKEGEVRTGVKLTLSASHFLAGRVLDPEGNPLPMVQVNAWGGGNSTLSVLTDNQGTFRLTDLPDTVDSIEISNDKYGSRRFNHVELDRDDAEFAFGKSTGTTMIGQVVDARTKEPLKDFTVFEYGSSPPRNYKRISATEFQIHHMKYPSNYQYRIESPRHAPLEIQFQVPPNVKEFRKTFALSRGGHITGRVVTQSSHEPAPGLSVLLIDLRAPSFSDRQSPVQTTKTGPDGKFTLDRVPSGSLGIRIINEKTSVEVWKEVTLKMDQQLDLGDVEIGAGATVRGQLLGLAPPALPAGQSVKLIETRTQRYRAAITDPNGVFEFTGLPALQYTLTIPSLAIYQTADVRKTDHLDLRFEFGTAVLRGRVFQGHTPIQAPVTIRTEEPNSFTFRVESGSDGAYEIANLPAGSLPVHVSPLRQPGLEINQPIQLSPTATVDRDFIFPAGRLKGRVLHPDGQPPVAGIIVKAERTGKPIDPSLTCTLVAASFPDGAFELTLPEGFYTVAASRGGNVLATQENIYVPAEGPSDPVELILPAPAP